MTDRPLEGQVGFVTGAGRGLGRGGAIMMGKFGAKVALVARTRSELDETKKMVEAEGGEALVLPVDLRDRDAIIEALKTTEKELGPISALVNNAAVLDLIPFEETDPEVWHRAFDVNIHSAYYAIRYLYPKMVERGDGSIHNVSSAAGFKGFINESAYCATKFALEGLSKALALEAMPHNILVTMSSPGIRTKPTSVTIEDMDEISEDQLKEWADPIVMGEAFAYLAHARDQRLAARRYDLYRVSEMVRQTGSLDLDVAQVISFSRE